MNGYYGAATWLTYMNMLSGIIGVSYAFSGNLRGAVVCLIICGVCDMFDGTVARQFDRTQAEKSYGIQIDSLADLVSFGVLPGSMGMALGQNRLSAVVLSSFYVLAALIRLAYFNVTELAMLEEGGKKRTCYEGLPVTSVAAIIPLAYLLSIFLRFSLDSVYGFLLGGIALAFLGKFRVCKLKTPHLLALGGVSVVAVVVILKMVVPGA